MNAVFIIQFKFIDCLGKKNFLASYTTGFTEEGAYLIDEVSVYNAIPPRNKLSN